MKQMYRCIFKTMLKKITSQKPILELSLKTKCKKKKKVDLTTAPFSITTSTNATAA